MRIAARKDDVAGYGVHLPTKPFTFSLHLTACDGEEINDRTDIQTIILRINQAQQSGKHSVWCA